MQHIYIVQKITLRPYRYTVRRRGILKNDLSNESFGWPLQYVQKSAKGDICLQIFISCNMGDVSTKRGAVGDFYLLMGQ